MTEMTAELALKTACSAAEAAFSCLAEEDDDRDWSELLFARKPPEQVAIFMHENLTAGAEAVYRFLVEDDYDKRPWLLDFSVTVSVLVFADTYRKLRKLVPAESKRSRHVMPVAMSERTYDDRAAVGRDRVVMRASSNRAPKLLPVDTTPNNGKSGSEGGRK